VVDAQSSLMAPLHLEGALFLLLGIAPVLYQLTYQLHHADVQLPIVELILSLAYLLFEGREKFSILSSLGDTIPEAASSMDGMPEKASS
jgi:hypothetical protein